MRQGQRSVVTLCVCPIVADYKMVYMRRIDLDRIFHERAFEDAQTQQSRRVSIKKRKVPPGRERIRWMVIDQLHALFD